MTNEVLARAIHRSREGGGEAEKAPLGFQRQRASEMKKSIIALAAAAALLPASSYAKDSTDIALALGTVLASEEFCGLNYDQAAIQEFVRKRVSPDDMDFPSSLESMTAGVRIENQTMSDSAKTAHCAQIVRIAKSYGFTH